MTDEMGHTNKKIEVLENLINEFQNRADETDLKFQEAMVKMAQVEGNLEKALERGNRADERVRELEGDLKAAVTCLKQIESSKNVNDAKQKEQQQTISSLESSIGEMEIRADSADAIINKLERRKEELQSQFDNVHTKREAMQDEQDKACEN